MARQKKYITSASSDKEIMKFIGRINAKVKSYNKGELVQDRESVLEKVGRSMERILTFDLDHAYDIPTDTNKYGELYVPKTQESVDAIRRALKHQENAREKQRAIDPNYQAGRTIAEQAEDFKTLTEKVKAIQSEGGAKSPKGGNGSDSKDTSKGGRTINRSMAMDELLRRYRNIPSISISEAIDLLFPESEDVTGKYGDLLEMLKRKEKTTGDVYDILNQALLHEIEIGNPNINIF